jgi:hypothetical protein
VAGKDRSQPKDAVVMGNIALHPEILERTLVMNSMRGFASQLTITPAHGRLRRQRGDFQTVAKAVATGEIKTPSDMLDMALDLVER